VTKRLAGLGQLGDGLDVLLPLRHGAALGAGGRLVLAEQFIERHRQRMRHCGQCRHRDAPAADFIRLQRLLRDAERLGELDLGDVVGLAQRGDALAQRRRALRW